MTITLILPQPPAYSETFFRSKIKGLQESGHKVILVTASTDQEFEGCPHLQHPKVSKNSLVQAFKMLLVFLSLLPYWKSVLKFIKLEKKEGTTIKRSLEKLYINATLLKLNTDWLHFGFATMAIDRESVAKAIGAKLGVSFRGYDIDVYPIKHTSCYKLLWAQVDKVHSISIYLLYKAYDLGLSSDVDYQIITPAVDLDKIKQPENVQVKSSVQLKILTIGRLHWIKGIDDLIETAFALKQHGIDFEWNIIGGGDQKHEERYKFHVYQKQLENQVKFIGKLSHKETLSHLNTTDIYVQTSLSEGFCNAVLEAQALGKLCLAYDAGALSENILNKKTGWLVPKGLPTLLADKILEVIQLDGQTKKSIQQKAVERVQSKFSLQQQKEKFHEFYVN
jgi:colanic acid/amylovoran biosynthesis glycosyltransferase